MENIVISWREVLLVGVLVLSVYIAEMLLFLRSRKGLEKQEPVEGADADKNRARIQSEELRNLASRLETLETQIQTMMAEKSGVEDSPYQRAIQMARQGREAGRISESCGISYGEAELIVSMHGAHKHITATDK